MFLYFTVLTHDTLITRYGSASTGAAIARKRIAMVTFGGWGIDIRWQTVTIKIESALNNFGMTELLVGTSTASRRCTGDITCERSPVGKTRIWEVAL